MNKKVKAFTLRFSEKDWEIITKLVKSNGTWASAWIREIVINELIRLGKRKEDVKSGIREKGR